MPVLEHVAAEQNQFDALMSATLQRFDVDEWRGPGDHCARS
jgi:hypothetical protein